MADDTKHILSHINFNGDSIDIQDAVARQAASDLADEISELAKNAVTNVAQGLTDYTIRVTKDGLAIDVPIKGLSSKLNELAQAIDGKASSTHTHTKSQITDFPTSMPASDVSDWAKASSKPSYSKSEVGLGNVDNTSDSRKPVSTAQQTAIDTAYANANKYTDKKVADLIGSAPETMDTLEEVAAAIQENKNVETALNAAIGTKANQAELDTHTDNSTIHITASERTDWNAAKTHADSAHARTDATKVEKSSTNGNIKINDTETTVYTHPGSGTNPHGTTKSDVGLGNVGNFKAVSTVASQGLTDAEKSNARANIGAGTSSFSGSYNDLSNKPTIPTNNNQLTNGAGYITSSGTAKTISDTLPVSKGGTGKTTGIDAANALINSLDTGSSTPTDADYYISQYVGGGTTTTTYHRRPMSALWNYIKSKLATVATSGSYNDLSNKPTIPSVGNGTVTIKQTGTSKGTFTMNQSGNTTIELTDSNTTYGVATSSALGLVKSGTDITVDSSGNVSVNDDSHNHVISNVDGLQSALDGKSVNKTLTNENLNNVTTPGFYNAGGGNTVINKPSGVEHFGLIVIHRASGAYYTQIIFNDTSSYRRFCVNGTWGSWAQDKLTDTNTWRGIQNNLTSDSTTDSLSAAQGKVLKGLVDGKAASSHTHTKSQITDFPSSLPANGGNASTVNGHTVESNVPSGAKFTDTTYTSKSAVPGGTDVSLVTTGEKATWNAKTSNAGTITGIKMNGASKGTSGVVDLGTVLTGGSQTSTSDEDGGENVYTFSDGSTITIKNGTKGDAGTGGSNRLTYYETRPTSANKASSSDRVGSIEAFVASSKMTTGKPSADAKILQMNWDNTSGWDSQLAMLNDGTLQHRSMSNGTWKNWKTVLDSSNYSEQIGFETGIWTPILFDTASHQVTEEQGAVFGNYYKLKDIVFIEAIISTIGSHACHHIGGLPYEPDHERPSNMYPIGIVSGDNGTNSPFNLISGSNSYYVQNGAYLSAKTCNNWYVYGWYETKAQ